MTQDKHKSLAFSVPLTLKAHRAAERFRQQQADAQKAKQVYLNTLAVYAVNFYLGCLGIETDLESGESWDPVEQTLADTGALIVKGQGKLECRPVLPNQKVCSVPSEVWTDRIGYVAVQLNPELTQATLIGFASTVTVEELPLTELESLAVCIQHLNQLKRQKLAKKRVQLSQWLHNVFDAGWEAVETLLAPQQPELAFQFRSAIGVKPISPGSPGIGIARGKAIDLERAGEQVALFVGLAPSATQEIDISVEVRPRGRQMYLPQDLQLMVLDNVGEPVMQANARSTKNIQLEFSGETGESFSVKVALGDVSVTEAFLI